MLCLAFGVLIGPKALGWLDLNEWGQEWAILREAARLTLAVALMGTALRIPREYLIRHWRTPALLTTAGMVLTWLCASVVVHATLDLALWAAVLAGAVITPTDPVLAGTIVTGDLAERKVPARIRHTLSAESGANDGLAYPLVMLPIVVLTGPMDAAVSRWIIHAVAYQVGLAVVIGGAIGYVAGKALHWAESERTVERTSFLCYSLALCLAVLGIAKLIGSDGVLAVFVAGLAFSMVISGPERAQEAQVQEAVNQLLILPVFVLLGAALPWAGWARLGWPGLLAGLGVLLLRRLPVLLALRPVLRPVRSLTDTLFLGWFGPIGVAALYYATLSRSTTGMDMVWWIGSLVILMSVVAHGVSAAPLTRVYGWLTARPGNEAAATQA
jgi:NhaP-type Na+/H+ or K+/H+ antiporter